MNKKINSFIMPTYGERHLNFIKGKGAYLFSNKQKKYLDFGSGVAVNSLGHCHPKLINALNNQSKKLWHTSNLYLNDDQEKYAELLCKYSFADNVFFTNSGTESIECGIKIIRSYHNFKKNINKKNIITFEGSFHGRSYAALSASKNKKYKNIFKPFLPGFKQVEFNNINALKKNIDENTAAILVETIQGEGGVRPISLKVLEKIKSLCVKNRILLFLDEVQCGFGRSGKLFSYQWSNIEPDIMALAKGIGSGFPLGACLANNKSSIAMTKGTHGSTFGGNPLAIAVGTAVLNEIKKKGFLEKVDSVARYLWYELKNLQKKYNEIEEVRGAGLLLGIKTKTQNIKFCKMLSEKGLLTVPAGDNVIRLAPPLIINKKECKIAINIIKKVMDTQNG